MRKELLGTLTYAEFAAHIGVFLPIMVASAVLNRADPTKRIQGRWMRRFGRSAASYTPLWKFDVVGEAPADIATRGYVVVANHESNIDPFLLSFLPWDMRWVAKEALFKVPVIGWLMHLSGDIPLRRGDRGSAKDMLDEARRTLERGLSIMMFPEGTRSKTGDLGAFKDGAFQLAIDAGAKVLPLALLGTRACLPKGSFWVNRAHATVEVLEAIDPAGHDVASLREATRESIRAALERMRAN